MFEPRTTITFKILSQQDKSIKLALKRSTPLKQLSIALSTALAMSMSYAQTSNTQSNDNQASKSLSVPASKADNQTDFVQKVNNSEWKPGVEMNQEMGTKVQALLNWNQYGVGSVDGWWGKNTQKAMQAFQKAKGITITDNLDQKTWDALQNVDLAKKPVLISYTLTDSDVNIKTTTIPEDVEAKSKLEGLYYESVAEAMAEKFHMSMGYLKQLNPNTTFSAGESLTVYNPGKANKIAIARVVADKSNQILYAYDKDNQLVASYPTTVGSTATPSPTGTHKVQTKVSDPNYTYTDADGNQTILPPGPNNPVGRVWIGLDKPSYGIHGSPDPDRISRQASSGCIRLTNWDAL
ncbi:L,D-transpeptidase family protein, partial [Psychrobacter sp.]|uniref:L,D-transpeptidase family protein n=1 Tax=Psychrobacter sp. TaxID=56811 RepID=UPI0026013A38